MFCRGTKYFFQGILRFFDIASDIFYLFSTEFFNIYLFWGMIGTMIAPSMAIILILTLNAFNSKTKTDLLHNFFYYLFMLIAYPTGISAYFFGVYVCCCMKGKAQSPENEEILYNIRYLDNNWKAVDLIFKCIPQIALQSCNNILSGKWALIAYVSILTSLLSSVYTLVSFCCLVDEERRKEDDKKITQIAAQEVQNISNNRSEDNMPSFIKVNGKINRSLRADENSWFEQDS
ncbi:hypothetical protein SteCoe_23773 [Stentor coeruleus]|uniref:XK-related protein n=1 Tax=Stentor coeruleus TaxID=5963 RepID=A0A1R2BJ41_9CILI|nr:hypothetical protein SteCoe_23773 [Stentor coeruleus]